MQASFHKISVDRESCENGACEGTQAVLAIFGKLPEGNLRVLGCIGSLSKTHTSVTAHLWTASGCSVP